MSGEVEFKHVGDGIHRAIGGIVGRDAKGRFRIKDGGLRIDSRVMELCDAIIARKYKNLKLIVQADCITMARREDMVAKMAAAGFCKVW